ncbi:MAG: tyrosine-type recombinase/integrase [Desulfosalsimonadaceae bacterium]
MDVLSDHTHHAVIIPVRQYLENLKALKYSQKSINSYNNALSRFVSFLTAKNINRVVDVTSKDLAAYRLELVDQAYAEHSIGAYLRTVRKLFKYLEDTRQIFVNPAASMIIPGVKTKIKPVPTEEDMKNLLSQPDISTHEGIRDRAILEILYSTGVRLEELIHMNIHDVRKKEKIIKVLGKGNKERMVPFGKKAAFWLTAYLQDVRPVFLQNRPDQHALWLGTQGNRIHPLIVERMVSQYGKQANITCRVTPHGLRRACATHMLRGGAHPVQIQLLLGHAGMSALSRYLKITVNDMLKMHSQTKPGR